MSDNKKKKADEKDTADLWLEQLRQLDAEQPFTDLDTSDEREDTSPEK